MRRTIAELYDLFNDLGRRINFFDNEIDVVFRQSEVCQRIAKVKGIGPKVATVTTCTPDSAAASIGPRAISTFEVSQFPDVLPASFASFRQ